MKWRPERIFIPNLVTELYLTHKQNLSLSRAKIAPAKWEMTLPYMEIVVGTLSFSLSLSYVLLFFF
jgi:hypothetical protein